MRLLVLLAGLGCLQVWRALALNPTRSLLKGRESPKHPVLAARDPLHSSPRILSVPNLRSNWFFLAEIVVLIIAKCNPHIGKTGGSLRPEFWINRVGVVFIFVMNGLSLSVSQLQRAGSSWGIHFFTQFYNLCVLPLLGWALSYSCQSGGIQDGIRCLAALPSTINLSITLTQASGADSVTAIFNSLLSNLIGVFWSPILVYWMLHTGQEISITHSLMKLMNLVMIPLIAGQLLRQSPLGSHLLKYKAYTKTFGEIILLGVVLNTFSDTFLTGYRLSPTFIAILSTAISAFYLSSNFIFWKITKFLFPQLDDSSRGAAMICSSQKTLAFGMPFIKAAFGHKPNIAEILTPLLLYYQIQVFLGSLLIVSELKKSILRGE